MVVESLENDADIIDAKIFVEYFALLLKLIPYDQHRDRTVKKMT